jgi:hypothetical protein
MQQLMDDISATGWRFSYGLFQDLGKISTPGKT